MRTTVDLPPELLAEAKERAARERRSLSDVVADAVRASFSRAAEGGQDPIALPTFGAGGVRAGVELDDTAALLELMEARD